MTDDQIHTALVKWLGTVTGATVIMSYQGGPTPPLPYVEVNFTGSDPVRDHESNVEYDGDDADPVTAIPVIEREWRFSVHAYSDGQPTDLLRPVESAARLTQVMEPMFPGLIVHEMSQIRHIPDFINEKWRMRAQVDIFLRGITRDGFTVDVIDVIEPFEFDREG